MLMRRRSGAGRTEQRAGTGTGGTVTDEAERRLRLEASTSAPALHAVVGWLSFCCMLMLLAGLPAPQAGWLLP